MLVYGECECFVMQMYVCVLCASCGSSQCCVLHDLQFVNAGRGCNRRPYRRGILQSRSHNCFIGSHGSNDLSLHVVELSGNNRCQQIEINTYPDSPLFISTGFLPRVSSKRLN